MDTVCFAANFHSSINPKQFIGEIISFNFFIPESIEIDDGDQEVNTSYNDFSISQILEFSDSISLKMYNSSKRISFLKIANGNFYTLYYTCSINDFQIMQVEKFVITNNYFISANIYDTNFVRWQNEEFFDNYLNFKIKCDPQKIYFDEFWGLKKVDISNNYGRRVIVSKSWLQSSWVMYFGKYFFEIIPYEKIEKFEGAEKIGNDVIKIKLYDNVFDSEASHNMLKMKIFRDYIGMDILEKALK